MRRRVELFDTNYDLKSREDVAHFDAFHWSIRGDHRMLVQRFKWGDSIYVASRSDVNRRKCYCHDNLFEYLIISCDVAVHSVDD